MFGKKVVFLPRKFINLQLNFHQKKNMAWALRFGGRVFLLNYIRPLIEEISNKLNALRETQLKQ